MLEDEDLIASIVIEGLENDQFTQEESDDLIPTSSNRCSGVRSNRQNNFTVLIAKKRPDIAVGPFLF